MNKKIFALISILFCLSVTTVFAQESSNATEETAVVEEASQSSGSAVKYIAAALAVGFACIGGGLAVGKIGSAAMGALAENPEVSGKALPFVGLAEGICLWGFLVGLLIIVM